MVHHSRPLYNTNGLSSDAEHRGKSSTFGGSVEVGQGPIWRCVAARRCSEAGQSGRTLPGAAAMGEPIEGRAGEALGAEDLCPGLEGQIDRHDQARALIYLLGAKI